MAFSQVCLSKKGFRSLLKISEWYLEILFEDKTTDYHSQVFENATSTLRGTFNCKIKVSNNVFKKHMV